MYLVINIFILILVLFIYIHICNNINSSNYLEIYEVEYTSKENLDDLCNTKQPIIFNNILLNNNISKEYLLDEFKNFNINLLNVNDIHNNISIPIMLQEAEELFKNDNSNNYISINNNNFLNETTLIKLLKNNDKILRPVGVSVMEYDILIGSRNSYTNLLMEYSVRNFIYVNSGSIEVTLTPFLYDKYLYSKKNDESMNKISDINIYNVNEKHKNNYNKIKFLQISISTNQLLFIPNYWYYSMKILEDNTLVSLYKYKTYSNCISLLPQYLLQYLQKHNIKNNYVNKAISKLH